MPDELAIFYPDGTTNFDSGLISGSGCSAFPYTNAPLTFVMNPNGNSGRPGDAWTYTVNTVQTNQYTYLVLTEDTNKTTTPIKFAVPPFPGGRGQSTSNEASGTILLTKSVFTIVPARNLFLVVPSSAMSGIVAGGMWMFSIRLRVVMCSSRFRCQLSLI